MKITSSVLRRSLLLAVLPTALAFTACNNDDEKDPTPTPDRGRVMAVHAAAAANVRVKVLADNTELGQLDYGQSSAYVNVDAGARTLKVNEASSNTSIITQAAATIEKDKSYSLFAYSPNATLGSAAALLVNDDLSAPAAGKAKIRLVYLGQGAASPVNLSQAAAVGRVDVITNVAFATASPFVEITPGSYDLAVTSGSGVTATTQVTVGDGSGSGTGTKAYAAGKIYTVVVRGIRSTSVPAAQQIKAVVIDNN